MTENKRYVVMVDTDFEVSLKDNITKKYPFSLICENIDEFELLLNEVTNVCAELNKNWEQTLRFEGYNKELTQRSVKYEDTIDELKHENNELTSIKRFADNHGINISKIDEAFRKCWNDNEKLVKDNEQLKHRIDELEEKVYHNLAWFLMYKDYFGIDLGDAIWNNVEIKNREQEREKLNEYISIAKKRYHI